MILLCIFLYAGISKSNGEEVPCEYNKRSIVNTIISGVDESVFESDNRETTTVGTGEQNDTETEYLEQLTSPFSEWLDEIVKAADEKIACLDDGDRDNIMYNPTFANDFIRLCKILPLWSGISCDLFEIAEVTSSSSNVESDFKNVKQYLADKIPCSVDVFVEEHIEMLRGATIEASQQHDYVTFIGNENNNQTEKSNDTVFEENEIERSNDEEDKQSNCEKQKHTMPTPAISTPGNIENNENRSRTTVTTGCRNGDEPGGAHRCIECERAVHILPCCSISIGDEEGYGERRLCNACASAKKITETKSSTLSLSQAVSEMEYNESWNKTKKKKANKFMKANKFYPTGT